VSRFGYADADMPAPMLNDVLPDLLEEMVYLLRQQGADRSLVGSIPFAGSISKLPLRCSPHEPLNPIAPALP
jgi:hypothetical protein